MSRRSPLDQGSDEANRWISPEAEFQLLAAVSIGDVPELGAGRRYPYRRYSSRCDAGPCRYRPTPVQQHRARYPRQSVPSNDVSPPRTPPGQRAIAQAAAGVDHHCERFRRRPEPGARPIQWAKPRCRLIAIGVRKPSAVHFAIGDDRMPKRVIAEINGDEGT